jgi:hypothetical protein
VPLPIGLPQRSIGRIRIPNPRNPKQIRRELNAEAQRRRGKRGEERWQESWPVAHPLFVARIALFPPASASLRLCVHFLRSLRSAFGFRHSDLGFDSGFGDSGFGFPSISCRRWDLNPHVAGFKPAASADLGLLRRMLQAGFEPTPRGFSGHGLCQSWATAASGSTKGTKKDTKEHEGFKSERKTLPRRREEAKVCKTA